MVLPSTSRQNKGFTLIEMLIAVGILAVILALGLFVSFDFYKSYSFSSEKNIIVSILQKARNQSVNNIDQARHGVHFVSSPSLQYIMFECNVGVSCTYDSGRNASKDNVISSSYGVTISPLTLDVVFDQLSGDCVATPTFNCSSASPITVMYGAKSYRITINREGQISW